MNITKEIITDLFPLYAANECSADTRVLVEDYLRQHPKEAEEFRRIMNSALPGAGLTAGRTDEMESLRRAQQFARRRSWFMGLAIFCSLAPFSFIHTRNYSFWLLRDAPVAALIYGAIAIVFWIAFGTTRTPVRSR